ncbi:response regulator [Campylobacter sp. RM13119]|uniref:response regulator transcription factor n=1 Tax=Campylobacter californiensis TaxID=1032243 RepID=UPI0014736824|nr:response regulator [Campylobacter sp. RM13119]MBE3606909.1 response regulator [Campylobacter sp. RM13119]
MKEEILDSLSKISILIVEDDNVALTLLKSALKPYCMSVYTANDGYEGIESCNKNNPDVILTDIHMPMMNGFEMMNEILKTKPHQKFIIFTSYDTDNNLLKSVKAGAALFLKKPIDIEILRSMLMSLSVKSQDKLIKLSHDISINLEREKIYKGGNEVYLTFLQNKLFWLLTYNLNSLVTYDKITEYVYEDENVSKSAIQNIVLRIKKELSIKIKNLSELGYMMTSQR